MKSWAKQLFGASGFVAKSADARNGICQVSVCKTSTIAFGIIAIYKLDLARWKIIGDAEQLQTSYILRTSVMTSLDFMEDKDEE